MSSILDALKKSESERQRQTTPGIVDVPVNAEPARAPRLLRGLGGLLAVNLIALLGVILRADLRPAADTPPQPEASAAASGQSALVSFASIVAEANKNQPQATPFRHAPESGLVPEAESQPAKLSQSQLTVSESFASFTELRANGTLTLPDLHLDLHVYGDRPKDRFVLINMSKYKEREKLTEGPILKEIMSDGVVLEHVGKRFVLPRE